MSIRPVDFGGMIQRTDDVGAIKHHEDQKAHVDQQHIQVQVRHEVEQRAKQVQQADDSEMDHQGFDAKDKGKNEYYGRDGKKKKQNPEMKDGNVSFKGYSGGFDIKI